MLPCIIIGATQNSAGEDANKNAKTSKVGIYFDRGFYKIGQKAIVIIVDKNLNKHHDAIDSYKPVKGFVSLEINNREVADSFASKVFRTSFRETGPHTGIFKALLKVPDTDDLGRSIKGKELRINYVDFQNRVTWHDTASIL
jgi:hypothetical protein